MEPLLLADLCNPAPQPFLDTSTPLEEARYVLVGAPFDGTSSYRSGSRFAPAAIRQASRYMETYSLRTGLDRGDVSVADAGDTKIADRVEEVLRGVEAALKRVRETGKVPVLLGGEHTVTLGALRALKPDLVVSLDAHLDLRDRLLGLELSHATFMRRALEELDHRLIVLGCRALSREELSFVESNADRVVVVTAADLKGGAGPGVDAVRRELDAVSSAYLSIDLDVLDPASAPAVGNPSPEGLSVAVLLDLIAGATDARFLGFDLTEVTPHYDSGLTATQAAYITLETLYSLESARRASWV
ncbi:agmatinase [Candidatus Bathyarchaeota archaeon]|nr:MAG: agmatinase [Candidatus Bathyarchaeota archaeon]